MADTTATSLIVAEMAEFARFAPDEQAAIEGGLALAFADHSDGGGDTAPGERSRAYRGLLAMRAGMPRAEAPAGMEVFMAALLRASALDLAHGAIASFSVYRFLYERLLGAAVRPWLPAAFCAAAALPQLAPERRKALLQTLSEGAATAPGWSTVEPRFVPRAVPQEGSAHRA